ncbi:hypothetical protein ANTQUA_LOCUS1572 [Anthophora quadrimaculata]
MYDLNDIDSKQLQQIRKYIPTATAENLRDYKYCMRTEAVKYAVPFGVLAAAGAYMILPKSLITQRKVILTGLSGIVGYIFGKTIYVPICNKKAFGTSDINERMKVPHTSDSVTIYDQEDQEKKYLMHPDKIEEEASWNNYDSGFQNYTSDFDYTNDVQEPEEEKQLRNKQEENPKKRITYDDLWRQHKEEEKDAAYKDLTNFRFSSIGMNRPVENERRKVSDKSSFSEAEDNDQKVWELK